MSITDWSVTPVAAPRGGRAVTDPSAYLANQAVFNVLDYPGGIDRTGVALSTGGIQAAMNDAAASGGGIVRVPAPGTYKLARATGALPGMSAGVLGAALVMLSGVILEFDPGAVLTMSSANTDFFYCNGATDFRINGGKLAGLGGGDQGNGFELLGAGRFQITNMFAQNIGEAAGVGGGGIVLTSCDDFLIDKIYGYDCGYTLINLFRCTHWLVSHCRHTNTRGTAAGPVTCVYVDATSGVSSDGVVSDNLAIGNNYAFQQRGATQRVKWLGNTSDGELGFGFTVQSIGADLALESSLVGNSVNIAAAGLGGINFDGALDCEGIANNISGVGTVAGILVNQTGTQAPARVRVTGNNVHDLGANVYAILVSAGTHVDVDDNDVICPATGQRSIAITGGSKHGAKNNRVVNANFHAIDNTTDDCDIRDNTIDGTTNGGDGIRSTGVGCNVTDNKTRGAIAGTPFNISGAGTYRRGNALTTGARSGRAVLVAGTVTVNTTEVQANDNIILSRVVSGGTIGNLTVGAIVAGTSFVISSVGTDTSTVFWEIVH